MKNGDPVEIIVDGEPVSAANPFPTGGGGGGAVTIADGADSAKGAKADAAVTDPSLSASEIALLKGNLTELAAILAKINASVPVTGTFFQATQPVSGAVTADTELPAAAALADASANPTAPAVDARLGVYNGTTWDRIRTAISDAMAAIGLQAIAGMLWNGTTFDRAAGDATGKAKVSLYAKKTTAGDTNLIASTAGLLRTAITGSDLNADSNVQGSAGTGFDETNRILGAANQLYNGSGNSGWDRQRANHEVTALASAARTASVNSADLINYNSRGVVVVIDVTDLTATGTLVVTIKNKDTLSGKYNTVLQSATIVATGTTVLMVEPGLLAAGGLVANAPIARLWRVEVVAGNGVSITYSVGVNYTS